MRYRFKDSVHVMALDADEGSGVKSSEREKLIKQIWNVLNGQRALLKAWTAQKDNFENGQNKVLDKLLNDAVFAKPADTTIERLSSHLHMYEDWFAVQEQEHSKSPRLLAIVTKGKDSFLERNNLMDEIHESVDELVGQREEKTEAEEQEKAEAEKKKAEEEAKQESNQHVENLVKEVLARQTTLLDLWTNEKVEEYRDKKISDALNEYGAASANTMVERLSAYLTTLMNWFDTKIDEYEGQDEYVTIVQTGLTTFHKQDELMEEIHSLAKRAAAGENIKGALKAGAKAVGKAVSEVAKKVSVEAGKGVKKLGEWE